LLMR
jgi:hypothetical protein